MKPPCSDSTAALLARSQLHPTRQLAILVEVHDARGIVLQKLMKESCVTRISEKPAQQDCVCLLVRNKPFGIDAFDLALSQKCVFIGYPSLRPSGSSLAERLIRFDAEDGAWLKEHQESNLKPRKEAQKHRNFLKSLSVGSSIIVLPRLSEGKMYLGQYAGFELSMSPPDFDLFLERYKASIDDDIRVSELEIAASLCQRMKVDEWIPVSFARVPAWIRKSVFGRTSIQKISSMPGRSAWQELHRLLAPHTEGMRRQETRDVAQVEQRLLDDISADAFEHLVVSLLQLENPNVRWLHVGGSGDGGVDGLGFDDDGKTVGVLQCKWQYDGKPVEAESGSDGKQLVIASMVDVGKVRERKGVEFWSRRRIAELVLKHSEKLPMALSLKVGRR